MTLWSFNLAYRTKTTIQFRPLRPPVYFHTRVYPRASPNGTVVNLLKVSYGPLEPVRHASDVAALIKQLNLGKVHLLGASRGGSIAVTVASLYPERIRTLILPEPNLEPLMPETPEKQKRMDAGKARADSVRANLAAGDREKAAREWLASVGGAWEIAPARAKQNFLDNVGTLTDVGERGKFTCADLQKFNFPILLLNGEKSPKLYGEFIAAIRECKPDIPAPLMVPNAGHSMNRENPELFNKVVLDFLNQH